jgi:hypothetical protein
MGSGELGTPHSGQSTSSGERASLISWERSAWTASSPPQVQPRWSCAQLRASMAMASLLVVGINATQQHQPPGVMRPRLLRARRARSPGYRSRVLRWLSALVPAGVLTGFAFLLVTGHYLNDGPVLIRVAEDHGLHEGDLFVLAGWLLSLAVLAVLARRPAPRGR